MSCAAMMRLSAFLLLSIACAACVAWTHAEEPAALPDYPDRSQLMVYRDADGAEHPVRSVDDWLIRRGHALAGMQQAMGPLPPRDETLPLDVQVEGEAVQGEGYRRLKISFVAEPGDRVPAFLYLPTNLQDGERRPAMLALHPTGAAGKEIIDAVHPPYDVPYASELASRGYVVISPDYVSFGDYADYDFANDGYESGTMKGIVNHRRAVDVLASRPEGDPERIGAIGHSLGGHNAMFVGVFDERLRVVVASCGWNPFHYYYGGNITGWTSDRYMPRLKTVYELDPDRVPFDFYEVVAALAPRAFFSNSPLGDANFEVAGVKRAIPQARKVYALYGKEDRLQVRYPDVGHEFPAEMRCEAYEFIDAVLGFQP